MSGSDYFTYPSLTAGQLARAGDVNARMALIQSAFGKLPSPEKVREGRSTYCEDSDGVNALVVSLDTAPASYQAGLELTVKVHTTNTGAATINVNGLGTKSIKRADGSAIQAGDLTAGQIVKMVYAGSDFRLLGASEFAAATSATQAAASAAAAAASAAAAAGSATSASTYAGNASTYATNAANSATAAANSASAAAAAVSGYAALAGATFTGAVVVLAPSADFNPATKKYVDDAVFAAGSVSADESTIHSASGVFSLKAIAANTVLGSVAGGVPAALTGTQLATIIDVVGAAKGLMSAADKTKLDAITGTNTGDQTTVSGNAGTATALQTARSIAISGPVTGTATSFDGTANITIPITALDVGAATTGTLAVARGGTGVTTATGSGAVVLSSGPTLTNPIVGTQASSDNSTLAASTAFVKTALAGYAPSTLTITASSSAVTLANSHNNTLLQCTGSTTRTLTAGNISTGVSIIIAVTGSAARTFSCAGGVYVDGATSTVTSVSIPAGSRCTAIHLGSGVWLLSGV